MTTYRVKAGAHVINGVMRNAGDTFVLDNDNFIDSPRRERSFERVATAEPVKEKKTRKTPEGGTGAPEGGAPEGGTGAPAGAPEGGAPEGGTGALAGTPEGGTGAPEGDGNEAPKKTGGRKKKQAE